MYISKENEKFYLRPYDFNMCRIMTALAEIVENNGGRVKPIRKALVTDRNLKNSEFVQVTHTEYIRFIYSDIVYYLQVDDNPFFPFYYSKTPARNGKFSNDAGLIKEFSKDWLYDCFFKSGATDDDIIKAANNIFEMLKKADLSVIHRDKQRKQVANTFDGGWHWETVYKPERLEKIDF